MGSTTMAFTKILVSVLLGSVAGQNTRTFPGFSNTFSNDAISTTTPIPILKFIDQQNNDGSYTYGFQSADGTYKIETRAVTGEVRGKYGYIDSEGNLKETSYGGSSEQGFVPVVDGKVYSPPSVSEPEINNFIEQIPAPAPTPATVPVRQQPAEAVTREDPARKFLNFPRNQETKVVNGRRAVLRKRLRAKPAPTVVGRPAVQKQQQQDQVLSREEGLRARQEGLRALEQQRAELRRLQNKLISGAPTRSQSARAFPTRIQNKVQQQQVAFQEVARSHPSVTGSDSCVGCYSLSY